MNKRIIIRLVLIMVGAIAILGTLMAITTMPNEKDNGFERNWIGDKTLEPVDTVHLSQDLSQIVGLSDHSVFIVGNSPTGVLIIDKQSHIKEGLQLNLKVPPDKIVPFYMKIDTPKLYLHLNNIPILIDGNYTNSSFRSTQLTSGIFMRSLQLNDSVSLIKTPDSTLKFQTLQKINLNSGKYTNSTILKDGNGVPIGISNDGMFFLDDKSQSIIYLEYFRNKFYVLDTNLSLKYTGNTIDTVASVQLKLASQVKNDTTDKITPSSARVTVNDLGSVDDGKLFISSNLRADNQSIQNFNSHINIDIYDITNGKYIHSLLLAKIDGKKAKSIMISGNHIYALFDKELRIYQIQH